MTSSSLRIALLSALFLLGAPAVARAEEPYVHDGFYLRLGLGLGYAHNSGTITADGSSDKLEFTIKGAGLPLEIALGGTLTPGLVLGGAIQGGSFPNPDFKIEGTDVSGSSSATLVASSIGPFLDYYPDPAGGLHFQGFVGFGTLSARDEDDGSSSDGTRGFALSGGVGHEWFVSPRWSIGVLGRLQYFRTTYEQRGVKETDSTIIPGVLASFTYH